MCFFRYELHIDWAYSRYGLTTQIAKTDGLTSIRHRSDTFAADRCLIDVDPTVFAIWEELERASRTREHQNAYARASNEIHQEFALLILVEICLSKFKFVSNTTLRSFSSSDLYFRSCGDKPHHPYLPDGDFPIIMHTVAFDRMERNI